MNTIFTRALAVILTSAALFIAAPAVACGPYGEVTPEQQLVRAEQNVEWAAEHFAEVVATGNAKERQAAWEWLVSAQERLAKVKSLQEGRLARK